MRSLKTIGKRMGKITGKAVLSALVLIETVDVISYASEAESQAVQTETNQTETSQTETNQTETSQIETSQIETSQSREFTLSLNTSTVGVFPRGVSYEGISLEGKTLEEAKSEISDYITDRETRYMSWNILGGIYEYSANSFGVSCTNSDIVNELDTLTMGGNIVEQYKKQKDLDVNPVDLDLQFSIDAQTLHDTVSQYTAGLTRSTSNASVSRVGDQFVVTEAVNGIAFDAEAIYNELLALITDYSTAEAINYTFPYTETPATYTSADFAFSALPLGSFSTSGLGDENRRQNISRAAESMNGRIFYPGETISALDLYGAVTTENGYAEAPGYNQGKVENVVGGGVCQVTTTLYNAVLRAELDVSYRKNHSMMVNYVNPGMDAMVSPQDNSDFKFVNSSNYPIYIEAYVYEDSVYVNIWGVEQRAANRSVSFRTEILSVSWPSTPYNIVVNDTECQTGGVRVNYKHKVEVEVHPAVSCVSYKQVYVDGQLVEETELNRDTYKEASGLIYRASDCNVTASVRPGNEGESVVFPYIGWTVDISVTTLDGAEWPYYE